MSAIEREVQSQPELWRRAQDQVAALDGVLPDSDARVAAIGCGTSWYMAESYASLREEETGARTDAFSASEARLERDYDVVVAISRSGVTTEVERALRRASTAGARTVVVTAVPGSSLALQADDAVILKFADERSLVQTRFATTALALLRASLGVSLEAAAEDADLALAAALPFDPADFERLVFLGSGWTVGLAAEAALKLREAAGAWSEAYPAMEYRHGPLSVSARTAVWLLSSAPEGLVAEIQAAGATVVAGTLDPMAELVRIHRLAVALAHARSTDPDNPPFLSRAVVLS